MLPRGSVRSRSKVRYKSAMYAPLARSAVNLLPSAVNLVCTWSAVNLLPTVQSLFLLGCIVLAPLLPARWHLSVTKLRKLLKRSWKFAIKIFPGTGPTTLSTSGSSALVSLYYRYPSCSAMLASITRIARFCLLGYVMVAVLYTTINHVLSPLRVVSRSVLSYSANPWSHYARTERDKNHEHAFKQSSDTSLSLPVDVSDALWPEDLSFSEAPFFFPVTELVQRLDMDHAARTPVQEATLLSKAFAGALHPTRIIPYYYRASGAVDADDVTITTLVTRNRFKVFRQLVESYRGPVSVTVHIPFPAHASLASLAPTHPSVVALQRLHALYTSSPLFSTYVDVHLALSPFAASAHGEGGEAGGDDEGEGEGGRQFNVWRNVARLFARTEFVMMLDVDFAVCTDWRGAIREAVGSARASSSANTDGDKTEETDLSSGDVIQRMRGGRAALVVPAFEYTDLADGVDQRTFPSDKEVRSLLVWLRCDIDTAAL